VLDLVRERRGEATDRGDLLSMLLRAHDDETGEAMTDAQLTSELLAFFMAGHETTATALTWTWYLLGRHPEEMRRVRDEVAAVLGDERPSLESLGRLTITRCAIEEAMRLYPPIAVMPRQAVERDEIAGHEIPAGSTVALSQFVTHRHPDVWERPDKYEPDRFLSERSAARPRFAFFPFLGGPHQCIGMDFALVEMAVVVAMVLQQFDLELVPGPEVEPKLSLALYPGRPIHATLKPPASLSIASRQTDLTLTF
jgi:cytochrome P450